MRLFFSTQVGEALFLPGKKALPPSQIHVETHQCQGQLSECLSAPALPTLLTLRLNGQEHLTEAGTWRPEHLPAVLNLQSPHAEAPVDVYDLYNLWLYDGAHFVGYFCFQRDDDAPVFVYNDCKAPVRTEPAIYNASGRLVLPRHHRVCGAWYRRRRE
jgi:hypothetical protein